MQRLELTAEEIEVLRDVLQHHLTGMEVELAHTDTREFKAMLKQRKQLLAGLAEKLSKTPVAA